MIKITLDAKGGAIKNILCQEGRPLNNKIISTTMTCHNYKDAVNQILATQIKIIWMRQRKAPINTKLCMNFVSFTRIKWPRVF